jgi:hypothetical protein
VSLGPAVLFMSFGAGLELEAVRKDVDHENAQHSKGTAGDARESVKRWMAGLKKSDERG